MGTLFRVVVASDERVTADAAIAACFDRIAHVDLIASEWDSASVVSELNRRAGAGPLAVPPDLFELLRIARDVAEQSEGAFDPTWAVVRPLWPFDGTDRVPDSADVSARAALIEWRRLALDSTASMAALERDGMAIGLGAIAKGFALDLASAELRRRGFADFILYAGGQVYAAGAKPGGRAWRIGVQDPRGGANDVFASLDLRDESASTSGDYEHFFIEAGVRYHHIIDTRTGYPARGARCATVIAADGTLADAYSTAAFVLGPEKGLALARERRFELLIVDAGGGVHMSDGMKRRATIHKPPRKDDAPP